MSDHARLGPSNHRWPNCPGSVREEANYPDIPGEAAIDGTGSHLLLELCLNEGVTAETYIGKVIGVGHHDKPTGWTVHKDRAVRVQQCLDYVSSRVEQLKKTYPDHHSVDVYAERIVNPGQIFMSRMFVKSDDEMPESDWWGTCDITIMVMRTETKCDFIEVVDYKDGRNWVDARNNSQLVSYAGGAAEPYIGLMHRDCLRGEYIKDGFRMTVVQPKTNPSVRYEDAESRAVINRLIDLNKAAKKTREPDAPLIPDDKGGKGHCRWCTHRHNCTELLNKKTEGLNVMTTKDESLPVFEQISSAMMDIETLSDEHLSQLADAREAMNAVFDKFDAEIEARIDRGVDVPGYAMKPGRGSRVYVVSEDEVAKALRARKFKKDDIYPPKIITPAQVLKSDLLDDKQKERFERDYIAFKAGDLKLTKVSRDEKPTAEQLFSDVAKTEGTKQTVSFI